MEESLNDVRFVKEQANAQYHQQEFKPHTKKVGNHNSNKGVLSCLVLGRRWIVLETDSPKDVVV